MAGKQLIADSSAPNRASLSKQERISRQITYIAVAHQVSFPAWWKLIADAYQIWQETATYIAHFPNQLEREHTAENHIAVAR